MRGPLVAFLALITLLGCQPRGGGGGATAPEAREVVGTFYDSLQRGLTRQAYGLLGADWRNSVPYDRFVEDFSNLRVADFRDLQVVESTDRLAKVAVKVRALPRSGAPRYYENVITVVQDPASGRWLMALSDSREIREEEYRE